MKLSYFLSRVLTMTDLSMAATEKGMFSLPGEQVANIDRPVATVTCATSSEVIRAGLRALQERDAAVERWLREEVVPVAAAMQANPHQAIPAETVFGKVRALHARRVKESNGDLRPVDIQ